MIAAAVTGLVLEFIGFKENARPQSVVIAESPASAEWLAQRFLDTDDWSPPSLHTPPAAPLASMIAEAAQVSHATRGQREAESDICICLSIAREERLTSVELTPREAYGLMEHLREFAEADEPLRGALSRLQRNLLGCRSQVFVPAAEAAPFQAIALEFHRLGEKGVAPVVIADSRPDADRLHARLQLADPARPVRVHLIAPAALRALREALSTADSTWPVDPDAGVGPRPRVTVMLETWRERKRYELKSYSVLPALEDLRKRCDRVQGLCDALEPILADVRSGSATP